MNPVNADMHCHSTVSDGWLTPTEVVRRAVSNGVDLLALTDHDETGGLDEAATAAAGSGLRLLPGVEISVSWHGDTVHVVGLGIDPGCSELLEGLRTLRAGRDERARRISNELDRVGIHDAFEGACRFARNPALVSRAHFARHIVLTGLMADVQTVFQYYLAKGKPGYVEHEWAALADAVRWIRAAGGVAVIAHPGRYRLAGGELEALLEEFVALGGEGVEVVSGCSLEGEVERIATLARRYGLLASRASDFHGPDESPADIGGCENLPPDLEPVWTRFATASGSRNAKKP